MVHGHLGLVGPAVGATVVVLPLNPDPVLGLELGTFSGSASVMVLSHSPYLPLV